MLSLKIEKRDIKIAPEKIRKSGQIPAVFYGRKEKSTPISIVTKDFIKVWKKAGESTVVTLTGAGEDLDALIQDVDLDPVTEAPRHADFYVFEKGQKIKIKVPIEFTGISGAVKDLGGILTKVLHDLNIEAEPKNLPHTLIADIASLVALDSQILAKDIKLPAGVVLLEKPEEVVAAIAVPKEEPVEEVPVDLSAIETVGDKGIKPKEGEEAEAGATPEKAEKGGKEEAKKEAPKK